MADLIDRAAAVSKAHECLFAQEAAAFEEFLELIPTVDAVEVVRCKDCIAKSTWYTDKAFGVEVCGLSGFIVVEDNDFCSYGERREDDG